MFLDQLARGTSEPTVLCKCYTFGVDQWVEGRNFLTYCEVALQGFPERERLITPILSIARDVHARSGD